MGIRVVDLQARKVFREKVKENLAIKNFVIRRYYKDEGFKLINILKQYEGYRKLLKRHTIDAVSFLDACISKKKTILFEGAQGTFLDVDHGTYPYVTSSNTISGNISAGSGVPPTSIDYILGICRPIRRESGKVLSPLNLPGLKVG